MRRADGSPASPDYNAGYEAGNAHRLGQDVTVPASPSADFLTGFLDGEYEAFFGEEGGIFSPHM